MRPWAFKFERTRDSKGAETFSAEVGILWVILVVLVVGSLCSLVFS